jgi:hypothetical protein
LRVGGEAARLFDRVVIDSAPLLRGDTLLMMPCVQTVTLVVRAPTPCNAATRDLILATGGQLHYS